ncbi:hypothetical protein LY76DRAFT_115314 [Colletotrichum caudatum]|nr:hypothetical protein LY76DRAFT_115314 [Colletotrichum caudatum]
MTIDFFPSPTRDICCAKKWKKRRRRKNTLARYITMTVTAVLLSHNDTSSMFTGNANSQSPSRSDRLPSTMFASDLDCPGTKVAVMEALR